MKSPFPGMDPFIEASGRWPDFHDKLIGDLERTISALLPDRYATSITQRTYLSLAEAPGLPPVERAFKPDAAIDERTPFGTAAGSGEVAVIDALPGTYEMLGLIEVEEREWILEIHELDPQWRLVTSIEVLSPSNKQRGSVGWSLYQRKRQVFLGGLANLVEVDLLLGGSRMPMATGWRDNPYYIMAMRKERAPSATIIPATFATPLPTIPIPLTPPDADILVPLQPLVDGIYQRSRYSMRIDYSRPLAASLSPADRELVEGCLRDRNPLAGEDGEPTGTPS